MQPAPKFIFHGVAHIPGIWMILVKVTFNGESLYHVTKTGHVKARQLTAPALDLPYRFCDDYPHPTSLRSDLISKGWPINECTFDCLTYGSIETHDRFNRLSWENLNRVVIVATYQAEYQLAAEGCDVLMLHRSITLDSKDLERSAHQLSGNFLSKIPSAYLTT